MLLSSLFFNENVAFIPVIKFACRGNIYLSYKVTRFEEPSFR